MLRIKAGPGGVLASMTQYSTLGATVVDRWLGEEMFATSCADVMELP